MAVLLALSRRRRREGRTGREVLAHNIWPEDVSQRPCFPLHFINDVRAAVPRQRRVLGCAVVSPDRAVTTTIMSHLSGYELLLFAGHHFHLGDTLCYTHIYPGFSGVNGGTTARRRGRAPA